MVPTTKGFIERGNAAFAAALGKGDAAAIAAVYRHDARLLAPNAPMLAGREAIREFWSAGIAAGINCAELTTVELDVRDDIAVEVGTYVLQIAPTGGDTTTDRGKYVLIHRRDSSGDWRWAVDIFNSDGAA